MNEWYCTICGYRIRTGSQRDLDLKAEAHMEYKHDSTE